MWHRTLATSRSYTAQESIAREAPPLVRMLRKPPCAVSYDGVSYTVKPVVLEEENVSYIAARMLSPTGRLWLPIYEHELSPRFPTSNGANKAWSEGFPASSLLFLSRQIIKRLIEEGDAEEVARPVVTADTP